MAWRVGRFSFFLFVLGVADLLTMTSYIEVGGVLGV